MEMKGWRKPPVALFSGKNPGARGLWKLWKTEKSDFASNRNAILQSCKL